MDAIMLDIMQKHGDQISPMFTTLFENNPIERILRFLDEEASLGEVGALIASLPPGLFLKTLAKSGKIRSMIWRTLAEDRAHPASPGYFATHPPGTANRLHAGDLA
jgi:hypothetical protein